jgi:hypothetical protein
MVRRVPPTVPQPYGNGLGPGTPLPHPDLVLPTHMALPPQPGLPQSPTAVDTTVAGHPRHSRFNVYVAALSASIYYTSTSSTSCRPAVVRGQPPIRPQPRSKGNVTTLARPFLAHLVLPSSLPLQNTELVTAWSRTSMFTTRHLESTVTTVLP